MASRMGAPARDELTREKDLTRKRETTMDIGREIKRHHNVPHPDEVVPDTVPDWLEPAEEPAPAEEPVEEPVEAPVEEPVKEPEKVPG